MQKLVILKQAAISDLRDSGEQKPDVYENPLPDWQKLVGENGLYETSITVMGGDLGECLPRVAEECQKDKPEHCLAVYSALRALTPQQATDERVWAYLTHFVFWDYARQRWPVKSKKNNSREKRINHVLAHFFVEDARGLVRDNAISRLWWMGHVASRSPDHPPKDILRALLHSQDVRKEIMERATFARSKPIFDCLMSFMVPAIKEERMAIFERERFRALSKFLNRIGGRKVLDALSPDQLRGIVSDFLESSPPH